MVLNKVNILTLACKVAIVQIELKIIINYLIYSGFNILHSKNKTLYKMQMQGTCYSNCYQKSRFGDLLKNSR